MIRNIISGLATAVIVAVPAIASAHVVVTPDTAKVGQELVFSISVPNERQTPVTGIKLEIPAGVSDVTPTVAGGWNVQTTTNGDGDDAAVTAITWTDGSIPVGQREDFSFGAQVPAKAAQLDWKAYQTYGDGTVVHWDQKPTGSDDASGNAGPYSVTTVSNDLTSVAADNTRSAGSSTPALVIALVALIVAIGAVLFRRK